MKTQLPKINWSNAPEDATHAHQTLMGRDWVFEKHLFGQIFRYTESFDLYSYRPVDDISIATRVARP